MEALTRWSSLDDQVKLATELFGPRTGEQKLAAWLAEQLRLVEDADGAADDRVTLARFDDPEHAIALIGARYARLADTDPVLANNLSIAIPEELRHWHRRDQLRAIRRRDITVGALAIVPGAIGWIPGEEVHEEVISEPHSGHGYATSAQTAWARHVAADTNQLLIGTIDRHNHASRCTAERAGRPRVLDDIFISKPPPKARHWETRPGRLFDSRRAL